MQHESIALDTENAVHFGIHRIYVQDLFGRYTYDLSQDEDGDSDASRLMILYGDNGSGKTNLLRLIVNLLSHVDGKGHKSRVANVKFKYLRISIGEYCVEAVKSDLNERGFLARVSDASGILAEADYFVAGEKKSPEQEALHKQLLKKLEGINVGLFFLADNRKVTSNVLAEIDDRDDDDEATWVEWRHARVHHEEISTRKRKVADKVLEDAVARVSSWATSKMLSGSTQGEEDVNSIYTRIIQQLARGSGRKTLGPAAGLDALVSTMQQQYERSLAFSQFGLTSPLKIDKILSSISKAPGGSRGVIAKVLGPYIDGMRARLDALQDVQNSISVFVEGINGFYIDKNVTFNLQKGLLIRTPDGESLKPTMLSSGERQLLLLFCNMIIARQRPSIFIIDEPELSLNVKWQRQLVNSLLGASKGSLMQFVLATHSIELLTRHKESVVQLSETQKALAE